MNIIKAIKLEWVIILALIGIIIFLTKGCNDEETIKEDIPVKIEVPIPAKKGESDTIYLPSPIKYVENPLNKELEEKYRQAKDSLEKRKVFEEAIKENQYNEIYEDSTAKVEVYTKTQGKLLKQAVKYTVKPYSVKLDTVITTEIKIPKRNEIYYGIDGNFNIKDLTKISIGPSLLFKNKKDKIIQVGVGLQDVNNGISSENFYIKGGLYFKF